MPLQLEVPGIDEVMWARGDVMFDTLVPSKSPMAGPFGLLRRTGYRIVMAAQRDLRLLRTTSSRCIARFATRRCRHADHEICDARLNG